MTHLVSTLPSELAYPGLMKFGAPIVDESAPASEPEAPAELSSAAPEARVEEPLDAKREYELPFPQQGEPLGFRQKEIARLIALGKTNVEIAEAMGGMNPSRISTMRKFPEIHAEAERYRDRLFEGDVAERLKELNASAFGVYEKILRDPSAKDNLKLSAATWILEKTTGKAAQAINVQSSTLDGFFKLVSDMTSRGEVIDVTAPAVPQPDSPLLIAEPEDSELADWVSANT